jgi:hypothetical protein
MQISSARATRNPGRLGRAVLAKLGKTIEDYFDEVVAGGVPERFRLLLDQVDAPQEQVRRNPEIEAQDKGSR